MNFGGLLGIVAVLAFGVGILGVAFAFTLASQGRSSRGGVLLALFGFAGGVVLFVVSSGISDCAAGAGGGHRQCVDR